MLASSVVATAGELEEVAAGYRRYLLVERGLSDATVECYEPRALRFLAHRDGPEGLRLAELTAADVSGFLAHECPRHGPPRRSCWCLSSVRCCGTCMWRD